MDKGMIIGAEHESSVVATVPFVTFRHATSVRHWLAMSVQRAFFDHDAVVAFVSASHFTLSPGSRPSARGRLLRVALPAPGFLRPRPRDSPSHGRRVRRSWRGRDDERRGQHPSLGHRIFRSFRRRSRCGGGMCAQDGDGALAASVRHRG